MQSSISYVAVVRQLSGSRQAVVRQSSGSCQADIRLAVVMKLSSGVKKKNIVKSIGSSQSQSRDSHLSSVRFVSDCGA